MAKRSGDDRGFKGEPVRSYRTRFHCDEDPISEGGIWINGKREGIDWTDIIAKNGMAYGAVSRRVTAGAVVPTNVADKPPEEPVPMEDYDDPTALLGGAWGRNQYGKARVFSRHPTDRYWQEVEIRLRSAITPNWCTGYEVFFRCLKTEKGYAQIVRWNGKVRDFTSLALNRGARFGVKDGDVIEASIIGNVIKGYINGVEVVSATDDTFASGNPGVGFNYGVGTTNVDHGFTSLSIDTYDD